MAWPTATNQLRPGSAGEVVLRSANPNDVTGNDAATMRGSTHTLTTALGYGQWPGQTLRRR